MLDKRTFEMINQEVDGTLSPRDSEKLKSILAKSPEARQTFDALKDLSAMLRGVSPVDPPSSLKSRILHSLPQPSRRPAAQSYPLFAMIQALAASSRVRYAYTFIGGAVAGILLFALLNGSPSDPSSLVGTMGSDHAAPAAGVSVELPEVQGTISAEAVGTLVITTATLNGSREYDLVLQYDREGIHFESFRSPADAPGTLRIFPGQLQLTNNAQGTWTFVFSRTSDAPGPLKAQILIDGVSRSEFSLALK